MNLPQETLGFRRASFSLASRYSYRHSLSYAVQHSFRYAFSQRTMLLYRSRHKREPEASVACFSPGHLRRTITRPVSYYALFE